MRRNAAEIALSLGVLALGIGVALVTAGLPSEGGYAGIGPNFIPAVVAGGILLVGAWLAFEAFTGGWRNAPPDDPAARGEHAFNGAAFGWISAGLFIHMALIGWAGFVVAGVALFACVARGLGSARPVRDLAIGLALSIAIFAFFVKLLNVNLPAGWLRPLLGSAGI
ncbi:MAG: tripartite tricarboxylate transporter TctB family protein [Betaproteobacteria bacterium]|nr:tripartite tricarboxylate transporter TctB family protein [Betaproteobacteria bacterium]